MDPIEVKVCVSPFLHNFCSTKLDIAAEGDDEVAACAGGEEACLDVHRSVDSLRSDLYCDLVEADDIRICILPMVFISANHLVGQVPLFLAQLRLEELCPPPS